MTITDRLIPFYVWFTIGFGILSIIFALISFPVQIVTMITVKGIYVPLWAVPVVAAGLILFCITTGYLWSKYDIQKRFTSFMNQFLNKEFEELCSDVKSLRKDAGVDRKRALLAFRDWYNRYCAEYKMRPDTSSVMTTLAMLSDFPEGFIREQEAQLMKQEPAE